MGLFNMLCETYENRSEDLLGTKDEQKEPLAPIGHTIEDAGIEITIDVNGLFENAILLKDKNERKTVIPVTIESSSRTGFLKPHPLCDNLTYLTNHNEENHQKYLENLKDWVDSSHHPKTETIYKYIKGGTLVKDLKATGILSEKEFNEGKLSNKVNKNIIRFRVNNPNDTVPSACWEDEKLLENFTNYYLDKLSKGEEIICYVSQEDDYPCYNHPRGSLSRSRSKLFSSNDTTNFTFKGRFPTRETAYSVGYISSQKIHNMLRWLVRNEGISINNRDFIMWNPKGKSVEKGPLENDRRRPIEEAETIVSYKEVVCRTLQGYKNEIDPDDDVVILETDCLCDGRASVVYYNHLKANDYYKRIENWYDTCYFYNGNFGIQSPTIYQIVNHAIGIYDKDKGFQIQKSLENLEKRQKAALYTCLLNDQPIPKEFVTALAEAASKLMIYNTRRKVKKATYINDKETMLFVACAVIRKSENQRLKKQVHISEINKEVDKEREVYKLDLDKSNTDRSYLFGRLLAVAEKVELTALQRKRKSSDDQGKERLTNAIRLQQEFAQKPLRTWQYIEESLIPYYQSLSLKERNFYKKTIGEIFNTLPDYDEHTLNQKLSPVYLLGYYNQRTDLYTKKDKTNTNEEEEE